MSNPYFNNVDFELIASFSLNPVIQCLGRKLAVLRDEYDERTHYFDFEMLPREECDGGIERILDDFFELISALDESEKLLIERCKSKVIDIGFMSGETGWLYESVSPRLVKLISYWGFELKFSVYGISSDN